MLLPPVADGIATYFYMADLIAIVADGIATWVGMFVKADLITLVADGKATGSILF